MIIVGNFGSKIYIRRTAWLATFGRCSLRFRSMVQRMRLKSMCSSSPLHLSPENEDSHLNESRLPDYVNVVADSEPVRLSNSKVDRTSRKACIWLAPQRLFPVCTLRHIIQGGMMHGRCSGESSSGSETLAQRTGLQPRGDGMPRGVCLYRSI